MPSQSPPEMKFTPVANDLPGRPYSKFTAHSENIITTMMMTS